MKIRWSIVFLALFGVVAAVAAAVLTASLSAQGIQAAVPAAPKNVTILVAARDLRAMETIREEDVVVKTMPEASAPESHYSDFSQVLGRVLSLPVVAGQPLARNSFPADGSGLLLAAHLPIGKRAVTLSLDDHSGLERIIYPGCIVNVVASFKIDGSDDKAMGRAVSTTMLQNIEVLAVESSTVVNKEDKDKQQQEAHSTRSGTGRQLLVTLMVDSKQAEALQLAVENGSVSLAMRNPADVAVANSNATLLAEGRLAQLAELLAPKVGGQGDRFEEAANAADGPVTLEPLAQEEKETVAVTAPGDSAHKGSGPWGIDVFRAMAKETTFIPVQK